LIRLATRYGLYPGPKENKSPAGRLTRPHRQGEPRCEISAVHYGTLDPGEREMIRDIAAIDDRLGLATATGIPWHIPADIEHFRTETESSNVLMGYATYAEFETPMPGRTNYVATRRTTALRDGFIPIGDLSAFLSHVTDDLWIIGGAMLYAVTLDAVQELVLTRVDGDFSCTKFFPPFDTTFSLVTDEPQPTVQGVPDIRFQTWRRN
jgi:dihydrofolate reductase